MAKIYEYDSSEKADIAPLVRFGVTNIKGIGTFMIAMNDRGLCWTGMTDSVVKLRKFFPSAVLLRDDKMAQSIAREIAALWSGKTKKLSVPLVLAGTDFERAVWLRLLKIKKGETVTYSDIARDIGAPKAVRAVGTAVGKNPITLVVPCHRVLAQAKGSTLKFGWGPKAKKMLLTAEGVAV